jgi:hypothetical protein
VLVEAGEHGECRVSEAAFGAFAAEAPVEVSDGGAYLAAEVGLLGLGGLRLGCVLLHRSLVYLTRSFVYLNSWHGLSRAPGSAPWLVPRGTWRLLTGREFFPNLISGPFSDGLVLVFAACAALGVIAAPP